MKEQTCNNYEENICVDKTSYCAIEVKNLDGETTGTFTIRFTHFEIQNQNNIIETEDVSFTLSPGEIKLFESEINIQSSGEDGNANKDISCTFSSEEIPTKMIC